MGLLYRKEVWLMNGDLGRLMLYVALGAAFNIVPAVQKGRDASPIVIGNIFLFVALAMLGSIWRYDVARMLAGIYLLSSFLLRGVPFVTGAITALTSFTNTAKDTTK